MDPVKKYKSIDLFSGCGGLTKGMHRAGFHTELALEVDPYASMTYKLNFRKTKVIEKDIREVSTDEIRKQLGDQLLHLLAGCPPCQGFSSIRRLNKKQSVRDPRNSLMLDYLRFVKALLPYTIMMENVPGLTNYYQFRKMVGELRDMGYNTKYKVVNMKNYGVPQSRERLVMVGSRLGKIDIAEGNGKKVTVKQKIGKLDQPEKTKDPLQKIVTKHTNRIQTMIALVPKYGGSRKDLPKKYILKCHKKKGVGFNDIYGRLRWNDYSPTITGGCLNPSKGRFLHPEQDRVITPREAAMIQSFPKNYKFPVNIPKASLALMIGNALPPTFSYFQSKNIKMHLDEHLG
jgi:DNA (cytosine-5)-methyltransferase 1